MWGNFSREFRGGAYDKIQEGRWCIAMNLAPVSNSMAALTGSESSPVLWKMASVGPRSTVTEKSTKRGNSAQEKPRYNWDHSRCSPG